MQSTVHERRRTFAPSNVADLPKPFQLWATFEFHVAGLDLLPASSFSIHTFFSHKCEWYLNSWNQSLTKILFFSNRWRFSKSSTYWSIFRPTVDIICCVSIALIMSDQASAIPYPIPPDGDQRIGNRIVVTSAVLIVPATVLIVLRLYVRTRITRATGFDDLLIVMSLVRIVTIIRH